MSNFSGEFHARFEQLRRDFIASKKVGPYFVGLRELIAWYDATPEIKIALEEAAEPLRRMAVEQYRFDAMQIIAAIGREKFESCAKKYGFEIDIK